VNTPAHLIANTALLGHGGLSGHERWILVGALFPDLGMVGFFLWQTFVLGTSQSQIWGVEYFRDGWQLFFDLGNSIPLAALVCVAGHLWRRPALLAFGASVSLHALLDLALHHDDGHRHFLPLSAWRYASPVSYWDPAHLGWLGALLELAFVVVGSGVLLRRYSVRWLRIVLPSLVLLQTGIYVRFVLFGAVG